MKIYEYDSYGDYVNAQTFHNKKKLGWVYVNGHTINTVATHYGWDAENILCHGTRNGFELQRFKSKYPACKIIGTEISETAEQFEFTVQHDFAVPKEEWINKFDIVYSNSFDHSIDPAKTLRTWRDQLVDDRGRLYLDYSEALSVCRESDPLDATLSEVIGLFESTEGLKMVGRLRGSQGGTLIVGAKE